jgi:hypothetical protein
MSVRAKFRVQYVQDFGNSKKVYLTPVTADELPENQRFHKYTPSGSIEMMIDNPPASDQFKPGMDVYVDFTPIVKLPPQEPSRFAELRGELLSADE